MNDNHGQRFLAIALPMALGKHLYALLDLDQPGFRGRQSDGSRQKKAGEGLPMSPAQSFSRQKNRRFGLRRLHTMILNGAGGNDRPLQE